MQCPPSNATTNQPPWPVLGHRPRFAVALISARGFPQFVRKSRQGRNVDHSSFTFPAGVARHCPDKENVFREFDQWFMPVGVTLRPCIGSSACCASETVCSPVATRRAWAAPQPDPQPGLPRRAIPPGSGNDARTNPATRGTPDGTFNFVPREWIFYPGFCGGTEDTYWNRSIPR